VTTWRARTHYTPAQRALYAAERANATPVDGTAIRDSTPSKFGRGRPVTLSEAASEVGVSPALASMARKVKVRPRGLEHIRTILRRVLLELERGVAVAA
jgi:hypothetical protein